MVDLQQIMEAIDDLSPQELEQLYRHIVQRRQPQYWLVSGEQLEAIQDIMRPVVEQASPLTPEEIDAAIDDALEEVRSERKASRRF